MLEEIARRRGLARAELVVPVDQGLAGAVGAVDGALQAGEVSAHGGDALLDLPALGRRGRAEEQELAPVAAKLLGIGGRALDLGALALHGRGGARIGRSGRRRRDLRAQGVAVEALARGGGEAGGERGAGERGREQAQAGVLALSLGLRGRCIGLHARGNVLIHSNQSSRSW